MRFRKLRIAWSVAWGVVAVLLVVLWVRSYWCGESLNFTNKSYEFVGVRSDSGEFIVYHGFARTPGNLPGWNYENADPNADHRGFEWQWTKVGSIAVPFWFLTPLAATLAAAAAARSIRTFRFSLRTLLIATTFVAVALGMIAWLSRAG